MVFEAIILGIIIYYLFSKNFKIKHVDISIGDLWLTIFGAIIFFISLKISLQPGENIIREYFHLIHPISLLIMSIGLLIGKNYFGKILLSLGFFCNALVVLVNKKMPVSLNALLKIKDYETINLLKADKTLTHMLMGNTKLNILGDIIPYSSFYKTSKVMSIGDILIGIGIGLIFASYFTLLIRREKND